MENRSFEGEAPSGDPSNDAMDNPSDPSNPRPGPSCVSQDRPTENAPPLARISDDESPPAYVQRHMPQEQRNDDLEDLEPPPPEPVPETRDSRHDPEFQQQVSRRRARRYMQSLVDGPCCLRSNSPTQPPPVPEPYPDNDPDLQPQPDGEPDTGQQAVEQEPPENYATSWERCVSCYSRICSFSFQFPFHTLLLTWPLSTAVMGVLNLNFCNMDFYLPYVMIAEGLLGLATILFRLYLMYYEQRVVSVLTGKLWISVRIAEILIWVIFATHLFLFFQQSPSFTKGEEHYCKPRFYKINCGLILFTSVTMIGWFIVNIGNLIYCCTRRNEHRSI